VRPFHTHLPLYSLKAAAGKFGHEQEVEEEDWVPVPGRLNERMFVARVTGRSMEPRIPDGSLNIFEAGVAGSRQGIIVLAELPGFAETTARFTVKKYSSVKRQEGETWRHESVTLLPLNREYEPVEVEPGQAIVIARWIATLE
jgi:phage repressor protein C with HTH and peptisase S24 domain